MSQRQVVYVLQYTDSSQDYTYVLGVFSSREKAEQYGNDYVKRQKDEAFHSEAFDDNAEILPFVLDGVGTVWDATAKYRNGESEATVEMEELSAVHHSSLNDPSPSEHYGVSRYYAHCRDTDAKLALVKVTTAIRFYTDNPDLPVRVISRTPLKKEEE